jgi:DNA-binding NarL/FixJ family response regulator
LIRVAVVAPSLALRVGLREVLGHLSQIEVAAESAQIDDAPLNDADVLVLASAGELHAFEGGALPPVLLLADEPGDVQALQRTNLPAWGVLPLNASEDELEAALRALHEGLWVGSPALLRDLLRRPFSVEVADSSPLPDPLTGREIEVLQRMAQGRANKQIALELGISEHTVKFHLSSLYAKLGVTSRTEAVRAGARRGLVVL